MWWLRHFQGFAEVNDTQMVEWSNIQDMSLITQLDRWLYGSKIWFPGVGLGNTIWQTVMYDAYYS